METTQVKDPRHGGPAIGEGGLDDEGLMAESVRRSLWQEVMFRHRSSSWTVADANGGMLSGWTRQTHRLFAPDRFFAKVRVEVAG